MALTIKVNLEDLARLDGKLRLKILPKAGARAANRSIGAARSAAKKSLQKSQSTQSEVLKIFGIQRATASPVSTAKMTLSGGAPLIDFNPEITEISTSRGIRLGVRLRIASQNVVIPGAFVATMPSGHEGVFIRQASSTSASGYDSHGHSRRNRLPIVELKSGTLLDRFGLNILADPQVQAAMARAAGDTFPKVFQECINDALDEAGE